MKVAKFKKVLKDKGFSFVRQKGDHLIYKQEITGRLFVVVGGHKDVKKSLLTQFKRNFGEF